jgi:tetratricopeptide (TPR) repeat protein
MMIDSLVSRAQILIQQKRYAEAEKLLKDLLSTNPNDVLVLTLLSETNLLQDKIDAAKKLANTAIAISPDAHHLFYLKSKIALQEEQYDEAEKSIKQAVEYDPSDADYYALWAAIKLSRKKYENALELANKALELDAENILALNTRSTALLKLDKHEESFKSIEGALKEDPENAYTHANYGWNLLEKGDHKKALEHFRESLKNDPNFDYAKAGMLEALKARSIFYRWFLKYSFWISNLTAKYQWGVILGFYFGFRGLRVLAEKNETIRPYLVPLLIALGLVAFSTWVISPVSNLFLRLNAYGKFLLKKDEIRSSNFVGISFVIFTVGVILFLISNNEKFLPIAVVGFAMMLPLGVMFSPSKSKYVLVIYTTFMALVGIGGIMNTFATGELVNSLSAIFIFAFMAFQWVANYFLIKESNR